MNAEILGYPNSYLTIHLNKDEQFIAERGNLIFADADYRLNTIVEAKSINNWLAKIFGGKSLTYNQYTALTTLHLVLSPPSSAELLKIELGINDAILIEPNSHFARSGNIILQLAKQDFKTTLNDGIKMRAKGKGDLFLKSYGRVIEKKLNTSSKLIVNEDALIAYDESLTLKTISKGIKELLTSGEGFLFEISGQGRIWLQTREKSEETGGGFIDSAFSLFR